MSIKATVAIAVHPGQVLQDILNENGVSQAELARHLGIDQSRVNELCRGRRGISASMAVKLAKAFSFTTPGLWLNLQKNWELSQLDADEAANVEPIRLRA